MQLKIYLFTTGSGSQDNESKNKNFYFFHTHTQLIEQKQYIGGDFNLIIGYRYQMDSEPPIDTHCDAITSHAPSNKI